MLFSIITPCYNSSKTLSGTYESLLKLDYKDFEWILIDDFSQDNGETKKLILELVEKAPFKVKYKFLSKNYFGSRSTYEATLLAEGEYSCILDHDDMLVPSALSIVKKYLEKYNNDEKIIGVCGRCIDLNNKFIGNKLPKNELISNEGEIRFKYKIKGEMFQFTRVDILKKYFIEMKPGYTNGYCWAKISLDYNYIYTDEVLRVYDTELETSYSNSSSMTIRYPENKAEAILETMECYLKYSRYNKLLLLKLASSRVRHLINAKKNRKIVKLKNYKIFLFTLAGLIPGYIKAKFY